MTIKIMVGDVPLDAATDEQINALADAVLEVMQ